MGRRRRAGPSRRAEALRSRGVVAAAPRAERGHVIDLMEALKSSLAQQAAQPKKPGARMPQKRAEAPPAKKAAKR